MKVAAIIALLLHYAAAQEAFSITSRHPPKADPSAVAVVHRVRKGESLTLSCSASEKFNMCRWARPSSSSKQQAPCGIFSGDERKRCGKSGSMSDWTVVREGETTCKVVIDEVDVEEAGEWSCELQSFPNENKAYKTAQEYTMVELVQPATVELRGALEIVLYEGEDAEFYCQATGVPGPQSLEFAIGRAPIEDLRLEEENFDDKRREVRATAKVKKAWGGKKLTCVARQVDDEGNEVESTDVRNLRVEAERPRHRGNEQAASAKAGEFAIFDRYPQGANGAYPTMTIAKEVPVTFSCTSTEPWHVCRWMRPDSGDPCGIFSDDTHTKSCSGVWGFGSGNEWSLRKTSPTTCVLSGVTHDMDNGEWNCELQSKPILNEHNVYESDQEYFSVSIIQQTRLKVSVPQEVELEQSQNLDIRIDVQGAYPLPELLFFLNTKEIKLEELSSTPPSQDGQGLFHFTKTVRYKADFDDTGKQLIVLARQIDDEQNLVEEQFETFLNVKAEIPAAKKATLSPAGIGGVVGALVLILLILILVGAAFRNGWLCFAVAPIPVVYEESKKAPTNEADIQTDQTATAETGNHAAFGPSKPFRLYDQMQGGSIDDDPPAPEFQPLVSGPNQFATDGTKAYDDEGIGSRAGSLPSLTNRSSIDERDWKDTLQVLGPKFSKLADYMRGERDDEDDEDNRSSSSSDDKARPEEQRKPDYMDGSEV